MSKLCYLVAFIVFMLPLTSVHAANEYQMPDGERLQDPTRPSSWQKHYVPATGGTKVSTSFKLNYIVSNGNERRAMINGKKVVAGDVVSGARVISITQDKVVLSYEGKTRVLRVHNVQGIRRNSDT